MIDDTLDDSRRLLAGNGRQKSMHLAVQLHAFHDFRAEHFERAAVVVQVHPGHGRNERVRHHRRQAAREERILAVLAPAAHDVGAALERLDHRRQVARIVLQIAVQRRDVAPARVLEAGCERRGLPEVAPQPDHPHVGIDGLEPCQDLEALVRAPIVDDDDFVRTSPGVEGRRELAVQVLERRRLVPDRDDDRELNHVRVGQFYRLLRCCAFLHCRYTTNPTSSTPTTTIETMGPRSRM